MFVWLLHNAVLAAILAACVALLCRWKRIGPALRHALWVLVLVRLLLPPGVLTWPWRIPLPSPNMVTPQAAGGTESAVKSGSVLEDVEFVAAAFTESKTDEPAAAEAPAAAALEEPVHWRTLAWWGVFAVWAGGAAAVASSHLRGLLRLLRLIRLSETAPRSVMKPIEELAGELGIRTPRVRVVAGLASPLVGGLLRPVLLWPSELHNRLPYEGLKAVLVHELAHLRRRDHWVRWLEMVAACLWWWNPLFRLARQRVRCYAELACDAWVLTVLPRARRAYAEALLKVCETTPRPAEPAPALGVSGDHADFERRLTMIMRESVACRVSKRWLLAIGILALLAIPGWSLGDPPAPASESQPTESFVLEQLIITTDADSDDDILTWLDVDITQVNETPDREERLAKLEAQIEQLLKEIRAIKAERGAKKEASYKNFVYRSLDNVARLHPTKAAAIQPPKAVVANDANRPVQSPRYTIATRTEVVMHRVTYYLPNARGKALAKFLNENVKDAKIQCSVDGDKFIVTTNNETLAVVGHLVQLVAGMPATRKK